MSKGIALPVEYIIIIIIAIVVLVAVILYFAFGIDILKIIKLQQALNKACDVLHANGCTYFAIENNYEVPGVDLNQDGVTDRIKEICDANGLSGGGTVPYDACLLHCNCPLPPA